MNKHLGLFLILLITVSIITSCAIKDNRTSGSLAMESFESFYERFLTDEKFQLERIKFPLKGRYMDNDLAGTVDTDSMVWTKENWTIIGKINAEDLKHFSVSRKVSDSIVIIKTEGIEENVLFEETYKTNEGKWFLVSLSDISI